MLDHERILAKLDELDGYQRELAQIVPETYAEYPLLLPSEEEDLFEKLERANLVTTDVMKILRAMRGFRNILVHEYGGVDNAIVFQKATGGVRDFAVFRDAVLEILRAHKS